MTPGLKLPQLETLAATPGILKTLLAATQPEQLNWKPSAERWSVSEVLGHLIHVEENNLRVRVRRIVEEDVPTLVNYDQMAEYAKGSYSGKDGREQLGRFSRVRAETMQWLRTVPASKWDCTGKHPEVGIIRARQVINLWAFHDLGHIRQIAELYRAQAFWDEIGSLQRYYSVRP